MNDGKLEVTFEPIDVLGKSPQEFITATGCRTGRVGSVDLAYADRQGGIVWCTGDVADGRNQDAAGIRDQVDVTLLVVGDGVSNSYEAQNASREATRVIIKDGDNDDLVGNVQLASEALRGLNLPEPSSDLSEYLQPGWVRGVGFITDKLLEELRREQVGFYRDKGSVTTLLQLRIDKGSGKVEGVFVGDGAVVIINSDGRVKTWRPTMNKAEGDTHTNAISTKGENLGQFSQQGFVLNDGETIMLCSDGATKEIVEAVAKQVTEPKQSNEEVAKRVALFLDQIGNKGDDVTIAMYTHKREV